jgi:hypothetical protein
MTKDQIILALIFAGVLIVAMAAVYISEQIEIHRLLNRNLEKNKWKENPIKWADLDKE